MWVILGLGVNVRKVYIIILCLNP